VLDNKSIRLLPPLRWLYIDAIAAIAITLLAKDIACRHWLLPLFWLVSSRALLPLPPIIASHWASLAYYMPLLRLRCCRFLIDSHGHCQLTPLMSLPLTLIPEDYCQLLSLITLPFRFSWCFHAITLPVGFHYYCHYYIADGWLRCHWLADAADIHMAAATSRLTPHAGYAIARYCHSCRCQLAIAAEAIFAMLKATLIAVDADAATPPCHISCCFCH